MIQLQPSSDDFFLLDGVKYPRTYKPVLAGEEVRFINVYSVEKTAPSVKVKELNVDGQLRSAFASDAVFLNAIQDLVFNLGGGNGEGLQLYDELNAYSKDSVVIKDEKIFIANDEIPANTLFVVGESGETWKEISKPTILTNDSRTYHITRTNDTEDVAPTADEVATPKSGDTGDVLLSNGKLEKWSYNGTEWSKDMVVSSGGEIQFQDELGNAKYSSDTDKRQGYFDETNKIYYPNVIRYNNGNVDLPVGDEGYWGSVKLIPIDGYHSESGEGSGSFWDVFLLIKFPPTYALGPFRMKVNVVERYGSAKSHYTLNIYGKLRDNSAIWENTEAFVTGSKASPKIIFGQKDGVPVVAFEDTSSPGGHSSNFIHIQSFEYGGGDTSGGRIVSPSVWLSGWSFERYIKPVHTGFQEDVIIEGSDALPHGKISVKDHLNSEQWTGNEIGFSDDFRFDPVTKRVLMQNDNWQTMTLDPAVATGSLKYKKKGDRLIIFGSVTPLNHTGGNDTELGTLPSEYIPDENTFRSILIISPTVAQNAFLQLAEGRVILSYSVLNMQHLITQEITLKTNDI